MAEISNPAEVCPRGYDASWEDEQPPEWSLWAPAPSTLLPCGCHLRRPDYEAVLCENHLAELNAEPVESNIFEYLCIRNGEVVYRS